MNTPIRCPFCLKENKFAWWKGRVEGPRQYHAACWGLMSRAQRDDALGNPDVIAVHRMLEDGTGE